MKQQETVMFAWGPAAASSILGVNGERGLTATNAARQQTIKQAKE